MFVFILTFFLFVSSALALPLSRRDVVAPPITSPTAGTIWRVGEKQVVTWQTTGLPVNQTNPVGRLVLGFLYNNSENLMLDSPLATGLNYSVGQAEITVPNVPSRTDYIIVLFGDSGNRSPEFTITNDLSSSPSAPSTPVQTIPSDTAASTPISTPPPPNMDSAGTGGSSSKPIPTSPTTATIPKGHTTSLTSTTVVVTTSATTSATPTSASRSSAAWQNHVPSLGTPLSVALAIIYFTIS